MGERKIRYRAYKKGKFWVYAAVLTSIPVFGITGGRALAESSDVPEEMQSETTALITTSQTTSTSSEAEASLSNTTITTNTETMLNPSDAETSSTKEVPTTTSTEARSTSEPQATNPNMPALSDNQMVWSFNKSANDQTSQELTQTGAIEGKSGDYAGIHIDASQTGAKFSPRLNDTQINAGTTFRIPIITNKYGVELELLLSGGTTKLTSSLGTLHFSNSPVSLLLPAQEEDTYFDLTFNQTTYLSQLIVRYKSAPIVFPGTPDNLQAIPTIWGLTAANNQLVSSQGDTKETAGIKIDTRTNGAKFSPRANDTQVNAGTILYIPIAKNQNGAHLSLSLSGGSSSLLTSQGAITNQSGTIAISIPASEEDSYFAITFTQNSYLNKIQLTYDNAPVAFPGVPENVSAKDSNWDLTISGGNRPNAQATKELTYQGIKIDASNGKFSPRDTDTQINAGTILYIPLAQDPAGASLVLKGNNYNNLSIKLDGTEINLGTEVLLSTAENRFAKLEFISRDGSNGSAYLTSISIDYASDNTETYHTVTVGVNGKYQSIQEALDKNTSSLKDHLVLEIQPGDYYEKVTVTKPGVIFKNADTEGSGKVVIRASYYSSNRFDANGVFQPKDAFDLGTDQSATVTIAASGTGFSAYGITFQNDYNISEHLGKNDQTPAVAFNSKADKINLQDCSFIGRQDTLYLQGSGNRVLIENSYIEGTVDFIFGNADAYIKDSRIYMAYFSGRKSGYFTAPNTSKTNVGFVFDNVHIDVSEQYPSDATISLGRPWQTEIATETIRTKAGTTVLQSYDKEQKNPIYLTTGSASTFINSKMSDKIVANRWSVWTRKDAKGNLVDVTYHPDVRFTEFNSQAFDGSLLETRTLPLGQMLTGDSSQYLTKLLHEMRMGDGLGEWNIFPLTHGKGSVIVTYKDDSTGQVLHSQTLLGEYGNRSDYQTTATIQTYLDANYTLISDDFPKDLVFTRLNKGQVFEIRLKHRTEVTEDTRVVTRTIHYSLANGTKVSEDYTVHLRFTRQATKDFVTGSISYSDWQTLDGNAFHSVTSPILIGYTPNPKQVDKLSHVTAETASSEITVTYIPKTVKARVNYIDDTNGKTLSSIRLSGLFGSQSDYKTNAAIQKYEARGYLLISDNFPTDGNIFTQEKETIFEIRLGHRFSSSQEIRTVSQIISYHFENGKVAAPSYQAALSFIRTLTRDEVTGKISYGAWQDVNGNRFEAVISPTLTGYTAKQTQIKALDNISGNSSDIKIKVIYIANEEKALINFIDDTNGKTVLTRILVGKYGTKAAYNLSSDIKKLIKQGYIITHNQYPSKGFTFDQDGYIKIFQVHLGHGAVVVNAANPGKPGTPLNSGSSVKWPIGTDRLSLTKAITRTIDYRYSDGRTAAKSKQQILTFQRELILDKVTGQIIKDGGWKAMSGKNTFTSVTSPKLKHYLADKKSVAPIYNVAVTESNLREVVTYTALPRKKK